MKKVKKLARRYKKTIKTIYNIMCLTDMSTRAKQLATCISLQFLIEADTFKANLVFSRRHLKEMASTDYDDTLLNCIKEIQAYRIFEIKIQPDQFIVVSRVKKHD